MRQVSKPSQKGANGIEPGLHKNFPLPVLSLSLLAQRSSSPLNSALGFTLGFDDIQELMWEANRKDF
jgi:hypothetical protein